MTYKTGDTVWYLDLISEDIPRIKQDVIIESATNSSIVFKLKNHYHAVKKELIHRDKLFPTKEALLAAIDPPAHNFVVGQDLWYVEDEDDDWGLRVEKGIVTQTTNESVFLSVANGIATVRLELNEYHVFASPQDAVAKALELKQW